LGEGGAGIGQRGVTYLVPTLSDLSISLYFVRLGEFSRYGRSLRENTYLHR